MSAFHAKAGGRGFAVTVDIGERPPMPPVARRVAFSSAALVAALTAAFLLAVLPGLFAPPEPYRGVDAYAREFRSLDMLPVLASLLIIPAFVALVASVRHHAPPDRRVLADCGLAAAVAYAAILGANYFVQLTWVRARLLAGDTGGIAALVFADPTSVFWTLEVVGYAFMSLAALAIAPLFGGSRIALAVRWLLVASAATGLLGALVYGVTLDAWHPIILAGLGAWSLVTIAAGVLLAVLFRAPAPRGPAGAPTAQ